MDPSPDPIVFLVQTVVSVLFAVVPAQHRHYVETFVLALVAAQVIVSVIVARLPLAAGQHPRWGTLVRAMHRFGHMRFRDELGTLKAPGAPPRAPTEAAEAVRRVVDALRNESGVSVTVNTSTPPRPAPVDPVPPHTADEPAGPAANPAVRDSAAFARDSGAAPADPPPASDVPATTTASGTAATTPAPETDPDR